MYHFNQKQQNKTRKIPQILYLVNAFKKFIRLMCSRIPSIFAQLYFKKWALIFLSIAISFLCSCCGHSCRFFIYLQYSVVLFMNCIHQCVNCCYCYHFMVMMFIFHRLIRIKSPNHLGYKCKQFCFFKPCW